MSNRGRGLAISSVTARSIGATEISLGTRKSRPRHWPVRNRSLRQPDHRARNTIYGRNGIRRRGNQRRQHGPRNAQRRPSQRQWDDLHGPVTENRTYANTVAGIIVFLGGVAEGNVSYSNATGIQSGIGGYGNGTQVTGNLIYANSAQGIWFYPTYASARERHE